MKKTEFKIQEAAALVDVHSNTLLNLEKQGIVHPARTLAGHRRYSEGDLQAVREYFGRMNDGEAGEEGGVSNE